MRRIRLIAAMPLGLLGIALIFIGVTLEQAAEWVAEEKTEGLRCLNRK